MKAIDKICSRISVLWTRFTGDPELFTLEYRITHSICLVAITAMAYYIPVNLVVGLPLGAIISAVSGAVFTYLYYRSRYCGKTQSSITMCGIAANILFITNFFFNSGISGSTDILMALSLLLVIAITPLAQHKIWLWINIITLLTLHLIEYYHPALIPIRYLARSKQFSDLTSTYVVVVILMYFTIKYIRSNYDYERTQVEQKKRDIEEQNKHILAQNEQLEQLNSEKDKLMSIVAHDLRSPLNNIQNYLELVGEHDLDADEREALEGDLLKVTRGTLNMLSKLLIWSKSQMNGLTVKLNDLNLLNTLKGTLEMEQMLASKKDITLTYKIDAYINVVADSDMLQLVVRNLVSNSIKFTQPGGSVKVRAKVIMNECRIDIEDNGNGIPPEKQGEIFSFKARSTYGTNNEKGVGLGLVLCKEFTEQQGGRIGFESAVGRGSTFFVFMPIN